MAFAMHHKQHTHISNLDRNSGSQFLCLKFWSKFHCKKGKPHCCITHQSKRISFMNYLQCSFEIDSIFKDFMEIQQNCWNSRSDQQFFMVSYQCQSETNRCISCGIVPSLLINKLWWNGPSWLIEDKLIWPQTQLKSVVVIC